MLTFRFFMYGIIQFVHMDHNGENLTPSPLYEYVCNLAFIYIAK